MNPWLHCTVAVTVLSTTIGLNAQTQQAGEQPSLLEGRVKRALGDSVVTIAYQSPAVAGRQIWGELIPYGSDWNAGGDRVTTIHFDESVRIGGNELSAGTYGIYVHLKSPDDWHIVFTTDLERQSGSFRESDEVLRIAIRPEEAAFRERLAFGFEDVRRRKPSTARLKLHWETKCISVGLETTGRRPMEKRAPELPPEAQEPFQVVKSALASLAAGDIAAAIKDFADDFETDFGDGGGKGAYAQLMSNLSRFGMLDEMEVILNDLETSVEGPQATFGGIRMIAPLGDMTMQYRLEQRDDAWQIVFLVSERAE